jgi:hypothetical protein
VSFSSTLTYGLFYFSPNYYTIEFPGDSKSYTLVNPVIELCGDVKSLTGNLIIGAWLGSALSIEKSFPNSFLVVVGYFPPVW